MDHEGIKVVNLNGNISNASRDELEMVISDLIQKSNVILNMRDVQLITSSGLDSLVTLCIEARQKNKRILVMGLRDHLQKMIDVLDLYEYFIFVESIEEGQMKLRYYT